MYLSCTILFSRVSHLLLFRQLLALLFGLGLTIGYRSSAIPPQGNGYLDPFPPLGQKASPHPHDLFSNNAPPHERIPGDWILGPLAGETLSCTSTNLTLRSRDVWNPAFPSVGGSPLIRCFGPDRLFYSLSLRIIPHSSTECLLLASFLSYVTVCSNRRYCGHGYMVGHEGSADAHPLPRDHYTGYPL